MSKQNKELPIIIVIAPPSGILPDGFPLKADNIRSPHDVLKKVARLDEIRLDKESSGSAEPPVEMWMIDVPSLRFARELAKHIRGIIFKVILDVPEADYMSPWSMLVSDLASYSLDQFKPHVSMEDPHKQVESKLTEESQVKSIQQTMTGLEALLSGKEEDDHIADLGKEGVDDTGQ